MSDLSSIINSLEDFSHGFEIKTKVVTADAAKKILENFNNTNRKLKESTVNRFARDMREGRWQLNGEPLIFSPDNILAAQHRLAALAKSGVSLPFVIVQNVDPKLMNTIDVGRPKTSADFAELEFGLDKYNASLYSGVAVCLMTAEAGQSIYTNSSSYMNAASGLVMQYIRDNRSELDETSVLFNQWRKVARETNKFLPPVKLYYLYVMCRRINKEKADQYFHGILTGAEISEDSVQYKVRVRLTETAKAKKSNEISRFSWVIKGFNAFVQGKDIAKTLLNIRSSSDIPEIISHEKGMFKPVAIEALKALGLSDIESKSFQAVEDAWAYVERYSERMFTDKNREVFWSEHDPNRQEWRNQVLIVVIDSFRTSQKRS